MKLESDPLLYRALELLHSATKGRLDALVGPQRAKQRQCVLSALHGRIDRPIPVAQCGVNRIGKELAERMGLAPACDAERNRLIFDACRSFGGTL